MWVWPAVFHTDPGVAGVVDPLLAPALLVQAAPLISGLLHSGSAATGWTEAVAAVPGQNRPGLGHGT